MHSARKAIQIRRIHSLYDSKLLKVIPFIQKRTEYTVRKRREYMNFKDKIALVTGGTSGIGLATANELLRNGLCHVFVTGIERCQGEQAARKLQSLYGSRKCSYLHLNVISEEQFNDAFKHIEKHFGGVDILFNNAGILEDKRWELTVETNFKSVIIGNLLGLKYMTKSGEKSDPRSQNIIINNADVCALDSLPPAPIYTATKYGVVGLTKSFGSKYHFRKTGVRVVALCCASCDTSLVKKSAKKQLHKEWGEETYERLTQNRLQKPSVIGRGVIHIIKYAPTNTIWTIENNTLYRSKIPHKNTYSFCVSNLK